MMSLENAKVYKLGGKTLQAAQDIYDALHSPAQTLGGDAFVHEYTNEVTLLGLKSKAIQVVRQDGALPRAYVKVPLCYVGLSKTFSAYMVAPVDFMGRHFVPEDAELLDDAGIAASGLWNGGWSDAEPLTPRHFAAIGTTLPVDFDEKIHNVQHVSAQFNDKAVKNVEICLDRIKQHFCDGVFVSWLEEDDVKFQIAFTCDENRRPLLMMAAHRVDNDKAVTLRSNGWLNVEKSYGDFYIVRPNVKSAGGMVLRDMLNTIPDMDSHEALWRAQDAVDRDSLNLPPYPPLELIKSFPQAPWPFPKTSPAP